MNKNDKNKNPVIGIVVAIALMLLSGGSVAFFMLLIVAIVCFIVYTVSKQKKKNGDAENSSAQPKKGDFVPQSFDPKKLANEAKRSFSKLLTQEMKKDDFDDCDDDHEHVEPDYSMPADEKRREQLKSMLKNGIIDREEYEILLKKYNC